MRVTGIGAEKTGLYPFVTKNINGKPMLVKSHKHRRQLMKQYGLTDDRFSGQTMNKRKRWYSEEIREKRRNLIENHYQQVKRGSVDLRPYIMAQKKREYEMRNGRKV